MWNPRTYQPPSPSSLRWGLPVQGSAGVYHSEPPSPCFSRPVTVSISDAALQCRSHILMAPPLPKAAGRWPLDLLDPDQSPCCTHWLGAAHAALETRCFFAPSRPPAGLCSLGLSCGPMGMRAVGQPPPPHTAGLGSLCPPPPLPPPAASPECGSRRNSCGASPISLPTALERSTLRFTLPPSGPVCHLMHCFMD